MEWVNSSTYIITKIYLHEKVACSAVVFLHRINTKNAIWTSSTPVLCVLGSTRCRWDGRSANVCESTIDITPRLMRAIALCRCSCTRTRSSDGSHKDTTKEVGGKCFNSTIPHNQTHFHRCTSTVRILEGATVWCHGRTRGVECIIAQIQQRYCQTPGEW